MTNRRITITLWGDGKSKEKWCEWYLDAVEMMQQIGYKCTHIGIYSDSYDSGRAYTRGRKEKEIIAKLEAGEKVQSLSCYSLPKDYRSAAFDYYCSCIRSEEYCSVILYEDDYTEENEKLILSTLSKYILPEEGEIFANDRSEVSLLYTETKDRGNLKTYEFIKKIDL
ncbi:hypothetical protein [Butyrivibrio proteoclasticus]|uniref:hypothetical protein n=1 Tax=Butyrivibrio proteoclasticus TaxID=43305 RepID=UPI00047EF55B|nr:hypothetical protein [Butyrivibrio proteoclasticus]